MREKLIALLDDALNSVEWEMDYYPDTDEAADILISNGVTIPVRCKDCKHYMLWEDSDNKKTCAKSIGLMVSDPDDFCSYGERKDNVET